MLRRGKGFATTAAWLVLLAAAWAAPSTAAADASDAGAMADSGRAAGKPTYVWLWYADGGPLPDYSEYCSSIRNPPTYKCNFGSSAKAPVADCQREVQAYLDDWYKDFNVVFTLTRPSGVDYYIIVITSGWPACAQEAADRTGATAANEGGIAPFNQACVDNVDQTAIAIQCGSNAHDCATIIAHEHGHLAGLVHTTGGEDVMHEIVQGTSDGFRNESLSTVVDWSATCAPPKQNSYKRMLEVMGAWPGGSKPSIWASLGDAGVWKDAASDTGEASPVDARITGGTIGPGQFGTDGSVTVLEGFDAYTRPPLVIPDAGNSATTNKSSGCSVSRASTTSSFVLALGAMIALGLGLRAAGLFRASARARRASTRRP